VLYAEAGAKGLQGCTEGVLIGVIVKLLLELSTKRLDWQVSNLVFVIAVSGMVLGVKADV
jgi:hypothetical protein